MILRIDPSGMVYTLYGEAIDLVALGSVCICRASFVEPDAGGHWWADLEPVQGPKLGPYEWRSEALRAESAWLTENWLRSPTTGAGSGRKSIQLIGASR